MRTSLVCTHCADSDIEKTYPAIQMAVNGSKGTTYREIVDIEGLKYWEMRMFGFGLIGGTPESMKFCNTVLQLPLHDEVLELFINNRE